MVQKTSGVCISSAATVASLNRVRKFPVLLSVDTRIISAGLEALSDRLTIVLASAEDETIV